LAENYELGVKILMSGNVAEMLGMMSSKLLGVHGQVRDIEKSLGNWKGLAAGAAAAFGGVELFKGLKDVIEHGAKLEKFIAQGKAAGYTAAQQADLLGAAWKNAGSNINASVTDSYKNLLELAQVTGSVGEAMRMLPSFTKVDMALGSLKDDEIRGKVNTKSQSYDFARTLELLGVTQDEKKMDAFVGTITREVIGMRGLVDGSKLFQGVQNAGGARYGWSADFVGHVLGPLIQASPRAGTGLFQLDRSLSSGVVTQMTALGGEKYGLWDKADEFSDAHGRFKGMKAGSIAGYDQLRADPEAWVLGTFLPHLKAAGVDINNTNEVSKAISEIARGNKNLNVILDELALPANRAQLAKERANIDRVPDDAADILQKNDPALAMQAFEKQWDNLLTSLGAPLVGQATEAIRELASAIQFLAKAAADHPQFVKIGGDLAAVAAGILTLGGSIAVLRFAMKIGGSGFGFGGAAAAAGGAIPPIAAPIAAGEGWLAKALRMGASAASLPGLIDWATGGIGTGGEGDKRTQADIDAILKWWRGPSSPFPVDKVIRAASPYNPSAPAMNYGPDYGREAAHGRALMALPPPPPPVVNNNIKVGVNVTLDGRQIAALVQTQILRENRTVNSSSGYDASAGDSHPDIG
jgi:hypothetical protein